MTRWTCPCCGASSAVRMTPEDVARNLRSAILASVVRALAERPMTYAELCFAVYRGNEPGNANGSIKATLHKMRHQVEPFGWRIVMPGRGKGELRLHLAPIASEVAA